MPFIRAIGGWTMTALVETRSEIGVPPIRLNRTQSEVSMGTSPAIASSEIENRTIRKLRWRILPFVFLLYVIAYLDRINIGFAALTMNRELAITSQQFGFLAGIFFFGYFIFEVPSNLLLHKIGAPESGSLGFSSLGGLWPR